MRNLEVRIRRPPATAEDFEVVPGDMPRLSHGGILCRAHWLAIDPLTYSPSTAGTHASAGQRSGEVVPALGVCEVLESRHDVFAVGQKVVLQCGMREICVSDGHHARALHVGQSPASTALGLLGPAGMAAYFGLLDLAGLRAGETVLVSAVANVAGAMAGQVARIKGARVIGVGSSREKCDWATRRARFSACVNPHAESLSARLRQLAPHGFDVYFDNSGGSCSRQCSQAIMSRPAGGSFSTAFVRTFRRNCCSGPGTRRVRSPCCACMRLIMSTAAVSS